MRLALRLMGPGRRNKSFTPAALPDLIAWYDAANTATITLDSGNVSTWASAAGGAELSQPTAGARPGYVDGVVTFDGNDWLYGDLGELSVDQEVTLFTVHDYVAPITNTFMAVFGTGILGGGRSGYGHGMTTSTLFLQVRDGSNVVTCSHAGQVENGRRYLQCSRVDADTAQSWLFGGDHQSASNAVPSMLDANQRPAAGARGQDGSASQNFFLHGAVCEVVVVERAVTTEERQQVEGYLAQKWGLTSELPDDHPYKAT